MQHLQELRPDIRLGFGKVIQLADVLFEIKELNASVFVVFEQLVLPQPYRPPGALVPVVAVMRKMPVDGATVMGLAPEGGQETDSVDVLLGQGWQARHFEQRRVVIGSRDQGRRSGIWLNFARPMNDQRHAYSTLVVPALGTPQGKVGGRKAAVQRVPRMIDSAVLSQHRKLNSILIWGYCWAWC